MRDNDRHRHDQSDEELFGDLLDEIGTEKSHGLGAAPAAESTAPEAPAEPQPSRPTPISLGGAGASALYDPDTEQDGDLGRLPSMTSSVRRRGGAPRTRRTPWAQRGVERGVRAGGTTQGTPAGLCASTPGRTTLIRVRLQTRPG